MSSIISFYSFKGGVGRSMALANIAFELARMNKKVLIVDWDLEAPGLEKYFSSFKIDNMNKGLLQLLLDFQENGNANYKDYLATINISANLPIYFLLSGRERDPLQYSSQLENFNWDNFFLENKGGQHLENLRQQWLKEFDFILIDSRTGLSDSSGVCTIMMPDILIPMFTANYQSLFGIRDIVKFIQNARQKLAVDRMALTILPIPSRFGIRVEFKESQEWLDRMADILKDCFSDWLPRWIEPKYILEQIKIPQIDYFGFGEKLAVFEHGISDREGMGYIYSKIASLLNSDFSDIESFVGRDYYLNKKKEFDSKKETENNIQKEEYQYDVFISCSKNKYEWVRKLFMPTLEEYLFYEVGTKPNIFNSYEPDIGVEWDKSIKHALNKSKILVDIFSSNIQQNNYVNSEISNFLSGRRKREFMKVHFTVFAGEEKHFEIIQKDIQQAGYLDLHEYKLDETLNSTRLRAKFGNEVEKLAKNIALSLKGISGNIKIVSEDKLIQLQDLAEEYDEIRRKLPSGNERTAIMTDIVNRMKNINISQEELLPRFINSDSRGENLIAIASLQKVPNVKYLDWLSERVGDSEKPFIGYNAATALFIAARTFRYSNKKEVENSLKRATEKLNKSSFKDPNQISMLISATAELKLVNK